MSDLPRTYKFWFQHLHEKEDYKQSLVPVATIKSLQDFWAYYQYLKRPSLMEDHHYLYLFQEKVQPMWEDPANSTGGALALMFDKHRADRLWQDALIALITSKSDLSKLINGVRLKIRKDIASIEVWVSITPTSDKVSYDKIVDWFLSTVELREDTHVDFLPFK